MKSPQRFPRWLPIMLLGLAFAVNACTLSSSSTPPPSTPLPTATDTVTVTPSPTPTDTPTVTPSPTATPTPAPVCGEVRTLTVLVIGAYPNLYGMADAIRLVHFDFVNLRVTVVPLPRDLMVTLPESAAYRSPVKLNSAYALGTPYYVRNAPPEGGAHLLQATIAENFGITSDRFLVVSGNGFARFIDALGGIPVYLPYALRDKNTHANFKAGHHWMTGTDALKLARIRMDSNDFVRIQRQSWLLQGVVESLLRPETLSRLPDIVQALQALYLTDLTAEDLGRFSCFFGLLAAQGQKPVFYAVPQALLTEAREPVYNVGALAPKGSKVPPTSAFVLKWGTEYRNWLAQALQGTAQP